MAFNPLDILLSEFDKEFGQQNQAVLPGIISGYGGGTFDTSGRPVTPPVNPLALNQEVGQVQQRTNPGVDYSKDTRKGIGKTLGDIADTLLMLDGGQPVFKQANQRERATQVLSQQDPNNPQAAIQQLFGIDASLGQEYQKAYEAQRLARQKEAREGSSAVVTDEEKRIRTQVDKMDLASRILRAAEGQSPETWSKAREQAQKLIPDIPIPDKFDSDFISGVGMSAKELSDSVEKRRLNSSLIGDRAHDNAINRGKLIIEGIDTDIDNTTGRQRTAIQQQNADANTSRAAKYGQGKGKGGDGDPVPKQAVVNGRKLRNPSTGTVWIGKNGKWVKGD